MYSTNIGSFVISKTLLVASQGELQRGRRRLLPTMSLSAGPGDGRSIHPQASAATAHVCPVSRRRSRLPGPIPHAQREDLEVPDVCRSGVAGRTKLPSLTSWNRSELAGVSTVGVVVDVDRLAQLAEKMLRRRCRVTGDMSGLWPAGQMVAKQLRSVRDFARKEWPFGQFG